MNSLSPSPLLTLSDIRALCRTLDISPTKKLGQNFVHDHGTLRRIVEAADLPEGARVIEIGPGLGSLTLALLEAGHRVTACEIDTALARALPTTINARIPDAPFALLHQDALTLSEFDLQALGQAGCGPQPEYLVANLPYNVSVPVLLHMLETFPSLRGVLVMVQKEVGERLCAGPGSKVYGIPSLKTAWYGPARLAGQISSGVFWPVPRVDSVLVKIDVAKRRGTRQLVFTMIDDAFRMRRKTLRANLKEYGGEDFDAWLEHCGIEPMTRAERLTIDDFIRLAAAYRDDSQQPATAKAPAKINVMLHAATPDKRGYHELATVFHSVDMWETVTVSPAVLDENDSLATGDGGEDDAPGARCISVDMRVEGRNGEPLPMPPQLLNLDIADNLAVRAVDALQDAAGIRQPYRLSITKQVPTAGGMAGGSADAAAALVAANKAFACMMDPGELQRIGRSLGADVPQALSGGATVGLRYGDIVAPLPANCTYQWVFVLATQGLSTPDVFQRFDALGCGRPRLDADAVLQWKDACPAPTDAAMLMENDVEQAAFDMRPELADVISVAEDAGALKAILSGSGPTIGCLCADTDAATRVAAAVSALPGVARTIIASSPVAGAHLTDDER